MPAIVYVLSNPAMPGLVKIGRTSRDRLQSRMNELHGTGVPLPFRCECAVEVEDERGADIEIALHEAFATQRVSPSREFFQLPPEQPAAILRVVGGVDVTPQIEDATAASDELGRSAARRFRPRRPNHDFEEMQIPDGSELVGPGGAVAVVCSPRKVVYEGEETGLTRATRMAFVRAGQEPIVGNPCTYWSFQDRRLDDIYNETYGPSG